MKKMFLLLLFISSLCSCQTNESLKSTAKKLFEANYLMDFEAIASYSYPKMIENMGKDNFLKAIEEEYSNDEFRLRYQLQDVPFKFGEIKDINGKSFCVITCQNPVRYTYERKLSEIEIIAQTIVLEDANNTKKVTFEPARNSFNIRRNSTFLAIKEESTNGEWKFFNLDQSIQWKALRAIFDESVIKNLGLDK